MGYFAILVACVLLTATISTDCRAQSVSTPSGVVVLNDPNVQYVGRWDKSNPALYHSNWGGAYLRTRFTGASVGIDLASGSELVVSIDGEAFHPLAAGQGVTALNNKPLKPETHTLLVGAAGQNEELELLGLTLDPGVTTIASDVQSRPLIEFVGDSITTGTGPDGMYTVNWAWNTAEALGCDHTQIAFSGRALTTGYGCAGDKAAMDVQYFRLKNFNHLQDSPPVDWNFSYTPDLVVINLGQNDQCGKEPPATMTASYLSFLHNLRARFATAQIVAMRPFGGAFGDAIKTAVDEVVAHGDSRVHYIDTTGWLGPSDFRDGVHPNGIGNLKVMGRLVPLLRPYVIAN